MSDANEMILRIDPENARLTVEKCRGGVIARKEITADALYECVRQSLKREGHFSGFLPANCLAVYQDNEYMAVIIWHPLSRADITLEETVYPNFPLPRLVFGFGLSRDGKVRECRLCVVHDETPRPETPLYKYPFSNVRGTSVCVGSNPLPVYRELRAISSLPDFILRIPNNFESYDKNNNKLKLEYRDLMERLKDKDSAYYYSHVLIPEKETLSDFIKGGIYQ